MSWHLSSLSTLCLKPAPSDHTSLWKWSIISRLPPLTSEDIRESINTLITLHHPGNLAPWSSPMLLTPAPPCWFNCEVVCCGEWHHSIYYCSPCWLVLMQGNAMDFCERIFYLSILPKFSYQIYCLSHRLSHVPKEVKKGREERKKGGRCKVKKRKKLYSLWNSTGGEANNSDQLITRAMANWISVGHILIITWSVLRARVVSALHFNYQLVQFCQMQPYNYL